MVTPAPKPFRPTRWTEIERVATQCLARLAKPGRPAEVRAAAQQQRADVAAQVQARTHGRAR